MTSKTSPVTSIDALRTIAHPARIRLYEILLQSGHSTVSQLADRANLAIGSASYHLQQLMRAGFVEEVSGPTQDRREHWWRAIPGGLKWSPADFLGSPSGQEISTSAQRMLTERRVKRLGRWNESWQSWGKEWVEAAVETDAMLNLTPQELSMMVAELTAVIRRWAATGAEPNDDSGSRSPVFAFLSAFPVEPSEARSRG
ncbi:helix-turn-helix domain-containing protein [Catellatospora sp. KI3]|uniref:ArsR/SmtB family transcription factor n=1 Tax=Catellatospora sp. KI3 TaxID=3041620 RepID=UPI002482A020|nr:helix-turn-helix domain-containing protein [Catellatospora sp. KI3]MDI1462214.1 helix-turn-helix domain-containing protein [Catellatospora sp. KI3]